MGTSRGYAPKPYSRCPAHGLLFSQANILINYDGHACLANFSLLTIASDRTTVTSSGVESTIRWMSPELIDPGSFGLEKIRPTKESDCYALGMVIHEVLSGQTPFTPWGDPLVIRKVLDGIRPERPEGEGGSLFTDDIWRTLELCWKYKPDERASAKDVLLCLRGTPSLSRSSSDVDGTVETDTDEQSDVTASDSGMCFSVSPKVLG